MNSLKNELQHKQEDGEIIHVEKIYCVHIIGVYDSCHRET